MRIRIRRHVRWFWLAWATFWLAWDVYSLFWGHVNAWTWASIAVMTALAVTSVIELAEPSPITTASPSEFASKNFDFAMGEVYGLRAWKIDDRGRLRALHVDSAKAWRPGVNAARCHASAYMTAFRYTFRAYAATSSTNPPPAPEKHEVPVEGCACGFYAYTDLAHGENRVNGRNRYVLGVIRGTGRTLIGTKGFRTEKAEIVALLDPTRGGWLRSDWRLQQRRLLKSVYPDVPLLQSKKALVAYRPIERFAPTPADDEFWSLP